MKKLIISMLALFFSINIFAYGKQADIDLSQYSYETVAMICDHHAIGIHNYSSTEGLELRGKTCPEAISYIKSIAAYPLEYTRISSWSTVLTSSSAWSHFLIEYLKKKENE